MTALWVVLMTNAINLIDGLDGLAAGIVAIAGGALFLFADRLFKAGLLDGTNIAPLVAIIAVGVCVGFLPFNWNPAKIIMGDAGALFLGCCSRCRRSRSAAAPTSRSPATRTSSSRPSLIPVVILGVPILDTVFSFVRRICRTAALASGRRRAPPPPADAPRPRPAPHGRDPVGVDRAAVGRRARCPTYTNEGNAIVPFVGARCSRSACSSLFHPGRPVARGSSRSGRATRRPAKVATATDGRRRPRGAPPQAGLSGHRRGGSLPVRESLR